MFAFVGLFAALNEFNDKENNTEKWKVDESNEYTQTI